MKGSAVEFAPFPLPLVPFELYMLAENTAAYPRAFVVELTFSGHPDRAALEAAWREALHRHPLLTARIERHGLRWRWVPFPTAPPIDWAAANAPLEFAHAEMIDLEREAGVRLWVRASDESTRLVLQVHHSSCDGIGCMQFVGDLLALYARQTGADSMAALPALEPTLLAQRGTFGLTRPTFREWLGHFRMTVRESVRLLMRTQLALCLPATDRSDATPNAPPLPFPGLEIYKFSPPEANAIRQTARQFGVTLNDLLMCHLYGAILDWNAAQNGQVPHGWLRINLPTNLRRPEDQRMSAANVMSFAFVDRHTRDCHDVRALLESIRAETAAIKRGRLGLYYIAQLALLARIPGAMSLVLKRRRCFATAVLTNISDPARAFSVEFPRRHGKLTVGNLLLENVVGTPPLRPLTHVGVGIIAYAGQLSICLLCDRHHFNSQQARRFLDTYLARIGGGLPQ